MKQTGRKQSRLIHCVMWDDATFHRLSPDAKLLFVYLLTSLETSRCGIHEIHSSAIAQITGLDINRVELAVQELKNRGRITEATTTNEVLVTNWLKWNVVKSTSGSRAKGAVVDAQKIGDEFLKQVVLSQLEETQALMEVGGSKRKAERAPLVTLSDDEHATLCKEFGDDFVARCYKRLSEYKTNYGRKYTSDYLAIKRWVVSAEQTQQRTNTQQRKHRDDISFQDLIDGAKRIADDIG